MKLVDVQPVYPSTEAPREQVVAYIKALTEKAKRLSEPELLHLEYVPGPDGKGNFVKGAGYDIACSITSATLQDWVLDDEEPNDLGDINGIAGQLEIDPDKKDLWQELFEKVDKLQA